MPAHTRPHSYRRRLSLAMLLSLLAHATALTLFVAHAATSAPARPRLSLEDTPTPPPPRNPLVKLGSETSQVTSITWIGFDEYKPHAADPSSVDQPDLTLDNPSPAGRPAAEPTPETEPTRRADSAPDPVLPTQPPTPPPPPVITQPLPPTTTDSPPPRQVAQGDPTLTPLIGPLPESPQSAQSTQSPALAKPQLQPEIPTPRTPPQPEAENTREGGGGGGGGASEETGQQSDKESQPSSIITAAVKELGQPLFARGLEMKTVRPRFTYYTQLTASPKNPLVRLHFDSNGKVQKAQIMQSSGFQDVDRPILDAMYQWRATGEQLKHLSAGTPPGSAPPSTNSPTTNPSATLAVDIRLLLAQ